jgi:hypothetical protein
MTEAQVRQMEHLFEEFKKAYMKKNGKAPVLKDIKDFKFPSRQRWSAETLRRFVTWCETNFSIIPDTDASIAANSGPFSISLVDSVVTAKELFENAVEQFLGRYLLFTWVGQRNVRITWIELKAQTEDSEVPTFEARRRDGLVFHGKYYTCDGTLFLFGHKSNSPLSRSLYFSRSETGRERDLLGIVSGASVDKLVFASSCYAHALGADDAYETFEEQLGDQTLEFVQDHYPHIPPVFEKHRNVQMDFPREPNS